MGDKQEGGNIALAKNLFQDLCFSQPRGKYNKKNFDTTNILAGSQKLNIDEVETSKESEDPAYNLAFKVMKQQLLVFFTEKGVITTPYAESLKMREYTGLKENEQALLNFVDQSDVNQKTPLKTYTFTTTEGAKESEEVSVDEYIDQCLRSFGKDADLTKHKESLKKTLQQFLGFPPRLKTINTEWSKIYTAATNFYFKKNVYATVLYEVLIRNMPHDSLPMEVNYYIFNTLTNETFNYFDVFQEAASIAKSNMSIQLAFDRELVFPWTFTSTTSATGQKDIKVHQQKNATEEQMYEVGDSNQLCVNDRELEIVDVSLSLGNDPVKVAKLKKTYTQNLETFDKIVYWPIVTTYLDKNNVEVGDITGVISKPDTGSIKILKSDQDNVCNGISHFEIEQYYNYYSIENPESTMFVNATFPNYLTLDAKCKAVSVGGRMHKREKFDYFKNYEDSDCIFDLVDKRGEDSDSWLQWTNPIRELIDGNEIESITVGAHGTFIESEILKQIAKEYRGDIPEPDPSTSEFYEDGDLVERRRAALNQLTLLQHNDDLVKGKIEICKNIESELELQTETVFEYEGHQVPLKQYRINFSKSTIEVQDHAFFSHLSTLLGITDPQLHQVGTLAPSAPGNVKLTLEADVVMEMDGDDDFVEFNNTEYILDMLNCTIEIVRTNRECIFVEKLWRQRSPETIPEQTFIEVFQAAQFLTKSLQSMFLITGLQKDPFDDPNEFLRLYALPGWFLNPFMTRNYWPGFNFPFAAMIQWKVKTSSNILTLCQLVYHTVTLFLKMYVMVHNILPMLVSGEKLITPQTYVTCRAVLLSSIFTEWEKIFNSYILQTVDDESNDDRSRVYVYDYTKCASSTSLNKEFDTYMRTAPAVPANALLTLVRHLLPQGKVKFDNAASVQIQAACRYLEQQIQGISVFY